jgi:hypothetical protein
MFYVYDTDSSIPWEFSCSLLCKVSPFFGKIYASLFSDAGPFLRAILSHLIDHWLYDDMLVSMVVLIKVSAGSGTILMALH